MAEALPTQERRTEAVLLSRDLQLGAQLVALNFARGGARQLGGERVLARKLERRQLARKLFARRGERSFAVRARCRNDIEHDFRQPRALSLKTAAASAIVPGRDVALLDPAHAFERAIDAVDIAGSMSSCQSLREAAHSSADQSSRRPWGTLLLAHSHSLSAIAPATSAGTSAWRPTTCHFGWSHSQSHASRFRTPGLGRSDETRKIG